MLKNINKKNKSPSRMREKGSCYYASLDMHNGE